jgi:hypothetical protein
MYKIKILILTILLTGCAPTHVGKFWVSFHRSTVYDRCGVDAAHWSALVSRPAGADAMQKIADNSEHMVHTNYVWFSSKVGEMLLCSSPNASVSKDWLHPDCFSSRWTFVYRDGAWLVAKDSKGKEDTSSTVCVD